MTAFSASIQVSAAEGLLQAAAPRRAAWPWMTTAAVFIAFFLAVHDLHASQHWLKTEKGDVNSLAEEESSGRTSRQIGFLLLGGVGVILLIRPCPSRVHPRPLILFPLSMLLLWALLSAAWSADAAITLKRQVVLVCTLLAAAGLIKHFTVSRLAEMALAHSLIAVVLGVVVELALRQSHAGAREEYRFAGTLHPNHMGINASLLLLTSLFVAIRSADRRFLLIAAAALATLLMTKSRTALASAIVGALVLVLLALSPRKRTALVLALLLVSGAALALVATDAFSNLGQTVLLNRASSDPTTLTGRTMIWQFAYDRIRDDWGRLLTGFGYGGFWTRETAQALSQRAHFTLAEGHNAYLDVLLQLGLIGLGLYLWCVLGTLWAWASTAMRSAGPQAALAAGVICFALNHHVAESAMTAPTFPTLILWCLIGSAALQREVGPAWLDPVGGVMGAMGKRTHLPAGRLDAGRHGQAHGTHYLTSLLATRAAPRLTRPHLKGEH